MAVTVVLCLSCNSEKKESNACLDARRSSHEALAAGNVEAASSALELARTECTQASDYDIDRLQRAVEREQRHQSRASELARQANAKTNPLTTFMDWVSSHRESGSRIGGQTECEPRESPRFGLCTTRVAQPQAAPFELHYWQTDPNDAYRFAWRIAASVTCDDTGGNRLLRKWTKDGAQYDLCELTDHGFLGLRALVVRREGETQVDIYSPRYPQKDPTFAAEL